MKKENNKETTLYLLWYVFKIFFKQNPILNLAVIISQVLIYLMPTAENILLGKIILNNIVERIKSSNVGIDSTFIIYFVLIIVFLFLQSSIYNINSFVDQIYHNFMDIYMDQILLSKYISLDPQTYEDPEFIKLKSKIDWNLWKIEDLTYNLIIAVINPFIALSSSILIFNYKPILVPLIIVSQIPNALLTLKFGKRVWGIWDDNGDKKVLFSIYRRNLFTDSSQKFQEIKILDYGKYLFEKAFRLNLEFTRKIVKNEKNRLITSILFKFWEYGFLGYVIFIILKMLINQNIEFGDFYTLYGTCYVFIDNINRSFYKITSIQTDSYLLQSFYRLLNTKNKILSGQKKLSSQKPISIEFKNVWFKYPKTNKWIFKDFSLSIKSNEDIAIVGENGAGKTTLIKLILRIYDINKGKLLINGIDIKELDLNSYYENIGILSQEFNKLEVKASENIHIGNIKTKPTIKNITTAAKLAEADKFIKEYPRGYQTFLTKEIQDGTIPSGGQWQRIAIARIFYRKTKLLILDEPTSAIDAIAEERIFKNIQQNSKNKTVIIVSHRFATVKKAKRIIVIKDGCVIEQGNHKDLMNNKKLYYQMYTKQQR